MPKIIETVVTADSLIITLDNGVTIHLASNKNYLHLGFSGIKDHVVATGFAHHNKAPNLVLANYVDLQYVPAN